MNKKTGLGKGFDGLIPTGFDIQATAAPGEQVKSISLSKIIANPDQPRRTFDENALKDLADSIKTHGIIQPIIVTQAGDNYRIVAGERRFRASQIAGLSKVPAIVRNHKELEELEIALVENVQRVDLSPIETAISLVRLRDQFSMTPKEISRKLGKAETTVSNIIRLLQLPEKAIDALQKNEISEGHARALLSIKTDEKQQSTLLNKIITQKLSVREAETQAKLIKQAGSGITKLPEELKKDFEIVKKHYGKNLSLKQKKQGGRITIDYKNSGELSKILKKLS